MKCVNCDKELIKRLNRRLNPKRKFCNDICRTRFNARKKYDSNKEDEEYKKKRKKIIREWYKKNKEKQKDNVLKNYSENREKWLERKYTYLHREEILELLPKNCANCGKEGITVIHHKTYEIPKRKYGTTGGIQEHEKYLKEYIKYLLGFCSKKCHKDYERAIKSNTKDDIKMS